MRFTSLMQRLALGFLLLILLPLLLTSYLLLQTFETELQLTLTRQLSAIADKKVDQINSYLNERISDASVKMQSNTVRDAMRAFTLEYARSGVESAAYRRLDERYRDYFRRFVMSAGYYDLFLISTQGTVVYSQTHEPDFSTNLLTGPYRDSGLAKVSRNALQTMESGVSEFERYAPSGNAGAAFIAVPVLDQNKVVGVLALQIDNSHIFKVLLDKTGLGESGETVVARSAGPQMALVLAPLNNDPDAALKRTIALNDTHGHAIPMTHALNGERGSGFAHDYDGSSVVAAWRYLPIMRAGIVSKMDVAEAMAPYYRVRAYGLAALFFALLATLAGAVLLGRRLVVPLKALSNSAGQIAAGKFDQRVPVVGPDELAELASSFNRMTENLQASYADLEHKVEQRTAELSKNLKEMRIKDAAIASSINAIAIAGMDGRIFYVNQAFVDLWRLPAPEGAIGRSPVEFLVEKPEQAQALMETLQKKGRWQSEVNAQFGDGSQAALQISASMMRDESGKLLCMMASFLDVSARKFAEQELQKSEALLESLIENMPAMVFVKRALDLRFEIFNRAGEALLGFSENDLLGKNDYDFFPREQADFFTAIDRAVLDSHQMQDIPQEPIVTRNGETRVLHTRKIGIYNAAGEPTHLIGVSVDITEQKRAEAALQRNQDLLNEAQRLGHLGSWELDLVSGELLWSNEIFRIFELDPGHFSPSYENFLNAIHPDDREKVGKAYSQSLIDRQDYSIVHRLLMSDDRIKWVREQCRSDFDEAGKPLRSVGAVQDITEQKLAEDKLRVAAVTFEMHEAIMITDANARIIRVNQAFTDITGYSADEVIGKNPRILSSGRQDMAFYAEFWHRLLSTGSWSGEIWDKRKNGQLYPKSLTVSAVRNEQGEVSEYVAIFSDITARKHAEEEIRNLAFYDSLTRLPNRRLLLDRFRLALTISARSKHYGAVMFLDMDRFKTLNDTLGHDYGDQMLVEVARRIQSCVREMDTVARLGGDEFVVLIEEVDENAEEASQKISLIAEKIRAALALPYMLKGHECHSSPSIGVSLYCGSGESVDELLKHADLAMYQAKDSGRNAVRFFDPIMQQAVENRAALETDLRSAVSRKQLHLHYQLQIDNEHRALGAEALIRWIHPQRGMVSPAQFIPVAEEGALILEIGHWVLDTACQQLAQWGKQLETRHLMIAVNVSAQQFAKHDFVENVATILRLHHVEPSRLKLELTESMVLQDVADVVKKMHALKALGVKLAMDDFGTGYSSLSYLKQLPLDQIKIDQSFVRDVMNDPNDAVLVQTIIDMGKNFRLNVIAEGVETEAQLDFLRHHGCMAYQGYLFSKPVPIEQFEELLDGYA